VIPPEPIELGISMLAEEGMYEEAGMSSVAGAPEEEGGEIPLDMPKIDAPEIKGEEKSETESENFSEGIIDTTLSEIGESGKNLDPKLSSSGDDTSGVGGEKGMFSITGVLSKRKILKKIIPPYPKGYEVRTEVKVNITVEPGGEVKKLLLMNTGGEIFDRITLEALREWKWEKLPLNAEQVDQEGIITFYYELR
jgi:hypothetical protein